MTWSEFCTALRDVATTGHITGGDKVLEAMHGLRMIQGSNADQGGLTLTENGRGWYQRAVVDRENERILEAYAGALDRMFDSLSPRRPRGLQ